MVSFPPTPLSNLLIRLLSGSALADRLPALNAYTHRGKLTAPSHDAHWLHVLRDGLGHVPFAIEATREGKTCGWLGLAYVRSTLFGRYLVSLPYLNSAGIQCDDELVAQKLINRAVLFAGELQVKNLELRHERPVSSPTLLTGIANKAIMRLRLPSFPGPLWVELPAKVRNQVRKAEKCGLRPFWGGIELLDDFYEVFSRNMRDLGTPVYGRKLFESILGYFGNNAEFCVVRFHNKAIASALLVHGEGITEVPSASSLREFNSKCPNMLMYWSLLDRAIEREQSIFDFGRSTIDGNTYRFKKQWGAQPQPAMWQYSLFSGGLPNLRPDNPRYQQLIRIWRRLPVRVTRWIGPRIVRGIP